MQWEGEVSNELNAVLDRMRSSGATMRLLLFFGTGSFAVAIFEPKSLMTHIFGANLFWWSIAVLLLAVLGFVETLINDILPPKWKLKNKVLLEMRYGMLFLCACFYGSIGYACSVKNVSWAAYPIFGMFVFFILLHMFLDIRARFKW